MSCKSKIDSHKIALLILLSIAQAFFVHAQELPQNLQEQIRKKVQYGQVFALRDYATLLDEPRNKEYVAKTLKLAFLPQPETAPALQKCKTKHDFFLFYYPLRETLRFDPNLAAFYVHNPASSDFKDFIVRPLSTDQNISYQTALNLARKGAYQSDTVSFVSGMQLLRSLPSVKQDTAFMSMCESYISRRGNTKFNDTEKFILKGFANQLTMNSQIGATRLLADLMGMGIFTTQEAKSLFTIATGMPSELSSVSAYRDSLIALTRRYPEPVQMRIAGMEAQTGSRKQFFELEDDFYGAALIKLDSTIWAQQLILQTLARSQTPRALYQIGTFVARTRWDILNSPEQSKIRLKAIVKAFELKTNSSVFVLNQNGASTDFSPDPVWLLNYGLYWAAHWDDFFWDQRKGHFVNKFNAVPVAEEAEMLFQQLASANDTVATQAFGRLCALDPSTVLGLIPEYTDLLRFVNPSVPPLNKNYLKAIVTIADWEAEYHLEYPVSDPIRLDLDSLYLSLDVVARFRIENRIIKNCSVADLMGLDLLMLHRPMSLDCAYSASRVLDQLYTKYWATILENDLLLRLYLKKSSVFQTIPTTGTLHTFTKKFDLTDPTVIKRLMEIQEKETDQGISQVIQKLWRPEDPKAAVAVWAAAEIERQQGEILQATEYDLDRVNALTNRNDFQIEKEKMWLRALLAKWPESEMVKGIRLGQRLSSKSDISFFEMLFESPEEYAFTWRWYNADDPMGLIKWYYQKIKLLPEATQGEYLYEFFRSEPFRSILIKSSKSLPNQEEILSALNAWYSGQDYLSEFEEAEIKLLFLLIEHADEPFANKIAITCALTFEPQIGAIQKSLIAALEYKDLKTIVEYINCFVNADQNAESLQFQMLRELGIPPVFQTKEQLAAMAKKPQKEAIVQGIQMLGISPYTSNGKDLDYVKIKEILENELITPLVNGGGTRRDWYLYSIIKVLEMQFQTTLGFHEKLNEDQSFFTYNTSERAIAWLNYLTGKGLIKKTGERGLSWQ